MIEFFCCANESNRDQAVVAVTSFLQHNPHNMVRVFSDLFYFEEVFRGIPNVEVEIVRSPFLLLEALDFYRNRVEVDRIVHLGANTLTQKSVPSLETVDMKDVGVACSSAMRFAFIPAKLQCYERNDPSLIEKQQKLNPRLFDVDFVMFNNHLVHQGRTHGYVYGFLHSGFTDEDDYINLLFRNYEYVVLPPDINVPVETIIPHDLGPKLLMRHCVGLKNAAVVRFPGEVTPWTPCSFNKLSVQFPMDSYLEAVHKVEQRLDPVFVEQVEENTERAKQYIGNFMDHVWL